MFIECRCLVLLVLAARAHAAPFPAEASATPIPSTTAIPVTATSIASNDLAVSLVTSILDASVLSISVPSRSTSDAVAKTYSTSEIASSGTTTSTSPHTRSKSTSSAAASQPTPESTVSAAARPGPETSLEGPATASPLTTRETVDTERETSNPFSTILSFESQATSNATEGVAATSAKGATHRVATVFGVLGGLFVLGCGCFWLLSVRRSCVSVTRRVVSRARRGGMVSESTRALVGDEGGMGPNEKCSRYGRLQACECCAPDGGLLGPRLPRQTDEQRRYLS